MHEPAGPWPTQTTSPLTDNHSSTSSPLTSIQTDDFRNAMEQSVHPMSGPWEEDKVSSCNAEMLTNLDLHLSGHRTPNGHSLRHPTRRLQLRGVAFILIATIVIVAVTVGVSKIRAKPTLHVTFPASSGIRKVRMFSDFPDLSQLSRNYTSLSLLSRLQLLDTNRCKDDLTSCQISVVCDSSTDQSVNCRCRHGFYFSEWQCRACSSECPVDHYLVSSCSAISDAICRPCSACGRTQYEAASCNTNRDTICIDVSFPVGILPMNRSHLTDDGIDMTVSYSSNVFMERLIDMEALETPMYVTNNQQSLDFVWPRLSGLDIAVSVTGVFLVPDYRDLEAVDDTALFYKLLEPSQNTKDYYSYVQNYYCRHPVPDHYSLQLEVIANRTSAAQVIRCDAQDDGLPRCPDHYKDGDRYLKWNINTPCQSFMTTKLTALKDGPNSIVCTDETDILRKVFRTARPTTQEYMFPSRECEMHRRQCQQCLSSGSCPAASSSNETYLEDSQCCSIHCYSQTSCKKTFSPECPPPAVECATGEVNIFSLFPHFDSMDRQFTCHLKYTPPPQLYSISYSIRAPSINFNTTPQYFTVSPTSRSDHERRLTNFDFMGALHDTRMKLEDEFLLIGGHMELAHYHDSLMKPYSIRELKTPADLSREKTFPQNFASRTSFLQFERPFMYSSLTWYKDGCHKNISQIHPNQTIYKDDFLPVMARKNIIEMEPVKALFRNRQFSYQLYHRDRAPFIKFYVEKGKSVLQHLQGTSVRGKLAPNSLHGQVSWHHDTSIWRLVFSATQDGCPTVISVKIFTQLMTGCAGHFDLLINCPNDFTVIFNFSTGMSDLPDTFVMQVNDSATSHNLVLSSVYPPVYVEEVSSKHSSQLREQLSAQDEASSLLNIWMPILFIVTLTLVLLIIIHICYKCINSRVERVDLTKKGYSDGEAVALNNQREQVSQTTAVSGARPRPKCFIFLFVGIYVIYSFIFTFSLTFTVIYLAHSSLWTNITSSNHLGKELHVQVNKSLHEIKKYEENERHRLFASYQERKTACVHHLENENRKLLLDYESTTRKQVDAIFIENGTLHYFTNEIQKHNVSAYMQQVREFVVECNKTLHSIVDRFQANYYQFVRNTANNDWLKVPRQIFLHQDGEDPNMKYLSSTQVKQFASWLEIDKTEELFAARENVFGRLSSIPVPHVSTLDVSFPSLHSHLTFGHHETVFDHSSHFCSVLEPLFTETAAAPNSSLSARKSDTNVRSKRDTEMFGLSGHLQHNPDSNMFLDTNKDSSKLPAGSAFENVSQQTKQHKQEIESSAPNIDHLKTLDVHSANAGNEKSSSDVFKDSSYTAEALASESSSSSEPDFQAPSSWKFYVLISVFLVLDVVLWVYRMFWLSNQLYAARHGYADRIPMDETCKQVLEIQTAYHLPAFENPHDESSGYYVDIKETLYVSDRENDITFLQTMPTPKSKDDILQKIWNEKMNKSEDRAVVRMRKCFLVRWLGDLRKILNRLFLSQLIWQGSVTFLAICFICLLVYCTSHWLTPVNFQTLVRGQSAAADVQWHLDTSDRYLHGLAQQLTIELHRMKHLCDTEVDILTDMFFKTVSLQTSMFTAILQGLCREAKGRNCEKIVAYQSTGGRIVGCNFLPLQAQTFHDLSLSHMEAIVAREVTPLVNLAHRMLAVSASVLIFVLCFRLLCQATATTVRHFLLLTGRLPRVRVYQSEEPQVTSTDPVNTTMQRSQSWVDSCESGVYLGEVEDANKEENR